MNKKQALDKIKELEYQLTGNIVNDAEIMDEIENIKVRSGIKDAPTCNIADESCESCSG